MLYWTMGILPKIKKTHRFPLSKNTIKTKKNEEVTRKNSEKFRNQKQEKREF